MTFQVFICKGRREAGPGCSSPGCHEPGVESCAFRLGGAKAGQLCGRRLCPRHARRDGAAELVICELHESLLHRRRG